MALPKDSIRQPLSSGSVPGVPPLGSVDHPFNPLALSMGADATFVARSLDRDPIHLRKILKRANEHKGASMIEIYQNCNVFNDGAFELFSDKETRLNNTIMLENGQPLIYGEERDKGIVLDGYKPKMVNLRDVAENDLWIHDPRDRIKADILVRFFNDPDVEGNFPRPFGIFYEEDRFTYDEALNEQLKYHVETTGNGDLDALLKGNNTWVVR